MGQNQGQPLPFDRPAHRSDWHEPAVFGQNLDTPRRQGTAVSGNMTPAERQEY
jgi:hypothetical protein